MIKKVLGGGGNQLDGNSDNRNEEEKKTEQLTELELICGGKEAEIDDAITELNMIKDKVLI